MFCKAKLNVDTSALINPTMLKEISVNVAIVIPLMIGMSDRYT